MLVDQNSSSTPPFAGGRPPVDRAYLGRFTLGDATLEREILSLFMAQIPLTLESLKFAGTSKEWCIAAHTLKGSANAVGAWAVAGLALEAEKLDFADQEACQAIVARIEVASAEVDAYFSAAFSHLDLAS